MSEKPDSVGAPARHWTRIDDYVVPMRWRSAAHRRRRKAVGHEAPPERLLLGMVPFMALILGLAVIAVAVFIAAWPGGHDRPQAEQAPAGEVGTAPPGWIDG